MKNEILKYFLWAIAVTSWTTICFILPDFTESTFNDVHTLCIIAVYLTALGGASFWVLYLIGLNRYVTWIILPLFGIGGAIVSYYRVAFHATITPMIIDATLHTNGGTIAGVISWTLVMWVIANALIAFGFSFWRQRLSTPSKAWLHAVVAIACLLLYYNAHWRLKASINQRYPYNVVHNFIEYKQQQQLLSSNLEMLPYQAKQLPDSMDIIFILGEAARADHMQLNGYERETMPLLANRRNVISFPHIYSEYTYTSTSVPVILSPADSVHPERSGTCYSFIRTFNECGFRTAWLSNQDQGRTYVSFIHEADTLIFPNANKSVFVFDPWYDEQLLPPLDTLMAMSSTRNLYVLHTIGSHWYYNLHVPEDYQVFQPITENRIITQNTDEQIINSYDNTIFYLDVLVDRVIRRLEDRCAIVIYLSDHGESLGEDGTYLHAAESETLHYPACVVWYSDKYAAQYPDKIKALAANKDKRYRTDFLYYSILSAASIETDGNNIAVDIFR